MRDRSRCYGTPVSLPEEEMSIARLQAIVALQQAEALAKLAAVRIDPDEITADTTIQAAMAIYAASRRRAGLKTLSSRRIREIARGKIALARDLGRKPKRRARKFRLDPQSLKVVEIPNSQQDSPTCARARDAAALSAITVQDQLDAALWSPGCSAFWLDPDRWHGVPIGADGRLEAFWLHLDKRPKAAKRKAREVVEDGLYGSSTGWERSGY